MASENPIDKELVEAAPNEAGQESQTGRVRRSSEAITFVKFLKMSSDDFLFISDEILRKHPDLAGKLTKISAQVLSLSQELYERSVKA